ncbi:MAG TPA: DUF362 domain-containing protein [Anaerolineales bacterium]|nr:DUF362 domain-containing protein [Anaerolineales bacterium]
MDKKRSWWGLIGFYALGVFSIIWLAIRSGSKPSRLAYPCQRAAAANSLGFLASHGIAIPLGHGLALSRRSNRLAAMLLAGLVFLLLPVGAAPETPLPGAAALFPAETRDVPIPPPPNPNPVVAVVTRDHVPLEAEIAVMVAEALQGALGPGGLNNLVSSGDTVLIKPNLGCGTDPHEITDWQVVKPIVQAAWAAGAAQVLIGEGEGCGYGFNIFNLSGYTAHIPNATYVDFNNTAANPTHNINVDSGYWSGPIVIPQVYFNADVVITVPVLKTHNEAGTTMGLKNAVGVPPVSAYSGGNLYRVLLHTEHSIRTTIAQINLAKQPDLAVIDALLAGEGQGPWSSNPVVMNTILAGRDLVALDAVGTAIMGIDPLRVPYLTYAAYKNLGVLDLQATSIVGTPIAAIRRNFALPNEANYIYRKANVIERTAEPLTIDGLLGDWYAVDPLALLDEGSIISGADKWNGAADLSLDGYFLFEQGALYAAWQVVDESRRPDLTPGSETPTGDRIELYLSLRDPWQWQINPAYGAYDFRLGVSYGSSPAVWDLRRGHLLSGAQVALLDTPNGYTLELRLPFSGLNNYTSVENQQIGLDFLATDLDNGQTGWTMMSWSGDLGMQEDVRLMGVGLFGSQREMNLLTQKLYLPMVKKSN